MWMAASGHLSKPTSVAATTVRMCFLTTPNSPSTLPFVLKDPPVVRVVTMPRSSVQRRTGAEISSRALSL